MEDAGCDFGALAEAQQGDPVARCVSTVVSAHCRRERRVDFVCCVVGVALWAIGRRVLPCFERSVFCVHRGHVGARLRREGRLRIDEAEGGVKRVLEDTTLHAEYAGVGAAAM